MFKKLIGKVNLKRMWLTVVVTFIYFSITDYIIHELILKDTYRATASVWRPEQELHHYMCWLILGGLINAKFFSFLFARGYEGKGVQEGFRFGLLVAPLLLSECFVQYAVYPLPQSLLWSWVGLGFIQITLGGVVASLVYRR